MKYNIILVTEEDNKIEATSYGGSDLITTDYQFRVGDRLEHCFNELVSHYVVIDVIYKIYGNIDLYIKQDYHSLINRRRSCKNCGTIKTMKEIQKEFPFATSCCGDRDMTGPLKIHKN